MKAKSILTIVLTVFVITSVAFLIAKENRKADQPTSIPATNLTTQASQPAGKQLVVYYFYNNMRCVSCKKFERWTAQTLADFFKIEQSQGIVKWQPINIDQDGNEHFVKEYQLVTKSVVLAEFEGDKQVQWKNLDKIWDMLGSQDEYMQYIKTEVSDMLSKASK